MAGSNLSQRREVDSVARFHQKSTVWYSKSPLLCSSPTKFKANAPPQPQLYVGELSVSFVFLLSFKRVVGG